MIDGSYGKCEECIEQCGRLAKKAKTDGKTDENSHQIRQLTGPSERGKRHWIRFETNETVADSLRISPSPGSTSDWHSVLSIAVFYTSRAKSANYPNPNGVNVNKSLYRRIRYNKNDVAHRARIHRRRHWVCRRQSIVFGWIGIYWNHSTKGKKINFPLFTINYIVVWTQECK